MHSENYCTKSCLHHLCTHMTITQEESRGTICKSYGGENSIRILLFVVSLLHGHPLKLTLISVLVCWHDNDRRTVLTASSSRSDKDFVTTALSSFHTPSLGYRNSVLWYTLMSVFGVGSKTNGCFPSDALRSSNGGLCIVAADEGTWWQVIGNSNLMKLNRVQRGVYMHLWQKPLQLPWNVFLRSPRYRSLRGHSVLIAWKVSFNNLYTVRKSDFCYSLPLVKLFLKHGR